MVTQRLALSLWFVFCFFLPAFGDFAIFQVQNNSPAVSCNFATGVATGVGAGTCIASPLACDGVTDDTAAFDAFVTWAVGTWQASHAGLIELVFQPGTTCILTAPGSVTFSGLKKLRISGQGMTLAGNHFHLGGDGQYQDGDHSTRIMAVSAGATSVTFSPLAASQPTACNSNATCAALFSVGGWALVAGFDLQTGNGFPSNPAYFQYVHITGVNSTTGVVTFDSPLTDSYKSTWPAYEKGGGCCTPDDGGPATLYAFKPGWDIEIEWRNVTFTSTNQMDAGGRQVVFRDVTFTATGNACVFPTQTRTFSIINASMVNCTMELDKMNEIVSISGTTISQIGAQSIGSAKLFNFTNSTVTNFVGTPKRMVLAGSTVSGQLIVNPLNYGRTESIVATNTFIASIGDPTLHTFSGLYQGDAGEGVNNATGWSMTGGIISMPNAYLQVTVGSGMRGWFMPGNNVCWADATYACAQLFQIQDVTQDGSPTLPVTISNASPAVVTATSHGRSAGDVVALGNDNGICALPLPLVCGTLYFVIAAGLGANTFEVSTTLGGSAINTTTNGTGPWHAITGNTYVHTSLAGDFPSSWAITAGKLFVQVYPVTQFTCTGCTGGIDVVMLNSAVPAAPLFTYLNQTYVNADTGAAQPYWSLFGTLQSMTETVNTAYTGAGVSNMTTNTLFGNWFSTAIATVAYQPSFLNLKVAGARTLTNTGYPSNWAGGQSGDTLVNLSQALWGPGLFRSTSVDISGDPGHPMSVTVTVTTDPGLVLPYLLKRDLDPAANDNSPMWLNEAA